MSAADGPPATQHTDSPICAKKCRGNGAHAHLTNTCPVVSHSCVACGLKNEEISRGLSGRAGDTGKRWSKQRLREERRWSERWPNQEVHRVGLPRPREQLVWLGTPHTPAQQQMMVCSIWRVVEGEGWWRL